MDIFHAIGEPTRRSIVEMLADKGQLPASAIAERYDMSAAAISQHLKVLREANVVVVHKRAQQRLYEINPDSLLALEGWAKQMTQLWNQRFDALELVLAAEKAKAAKAAPAMVRQTTGKHNPKKPATMSLTKSSKSSN